MEIPSWYLQWARTFYFKNLTWCSILDYNDPTDFVHMAVEFYLVVRSRKTLREETVKQYMKVSFKHHVVDLLRRKKSESEYLSSIKLFQEPSVFADPSTPGELLVRLAELNSAIKKNLERAVDGNYVCSRWKQEVIESL